MSDPALFIEPADYHHAVETLKALLAFWLMVNHDVPDRGMGQMMNQMPLERIETGTYQPTL